MKLTVPRSNFEPCKNWPLTKSGSCWSFASFDDSLKAVIIELGVKFSALLFLKLIGFEADNFSRRIGNLYASVLS